MDNGVLGYIVIINSIQNNSFIIGYNLLLIMAKPLLIPLIERTRDYISVCDDLYVNCITASFSNLF